MHQSFPLPFIYSFLFHTIQCLWGSVKASRSLVILFAAGSPCIHRCKFLIPTIHALSLPAKVVSHSKITPLITLGSQLNDFWHSGAKGSPTNYKHEQFCIDDFQALWYLVSAAWFQTEMQNGLESTIYSLILLLINVKSTIILYYILFFLFKNKSHTLPYFSYN